MSHSIAGREDAVDFNDDIKDNVAHNWALTFGLNFGFGSGHIAGSGRAKLDDEVIEVDTWDALRVAP